MTLGSLFDGSGGFPLGAILCGITPVWAAEVEPYPIKVTKTRLPFMKHLGNVTEIDGAKIEPVDIITFGSPCQDLSINGDSARYKMWGNGVALPNVIFVLSGIAEGSEYGNELLCSDEETNSSGSDSYR